MKKIKAFLQKETVLCIAALCAVATMFLVPPDGEYLHYIDWRVLCLLPGQPVEGAQALEARHHRHQAKQQTQHPPVDVMQIFPVRRHQRHGGQGAQGGDAQDRLLLNE